MAKIAKGQITLVDLNDGTSASMYLTTNVAYVQIYKDEEYIPDYTQGAGLVVTPHLYIGSSTNNVAANLASDKIVWTINGTQIGTDDYDSVYSAKVSTISGNVLLIKNNIRSNQYIITCRVTYNDPNTGAELVQLNTIVASKIQSSESSITTVLFPEDGLSFVDQNNSEVKLTASVFHGSNRCNGEGADDKYAVKYQWGYFNTTTNSFVGFNSTGNLSETDLEDPVKIYATINTSNQDGGVERFYTTTDPNEACVIIDKDTITLKADAINNKESIKCIATVYGTTDLNKPNTNVIYGSDADIFVVDDRTDPYSVEIGFSTMQLTTNMPYTILTANVYQGDKLVDPNIPGRFKYDWDAYTISNDPDDTTTSYWPQYETELESDNTPIDRNESYNNPAWWHCKDSKGAHFAQYTGDQSVQIWKDQITGAANVTCTVSINLD